MTEQQLSGIDQKKEYLRYKCAIGAQRRHIGKKANKAEYVARLRHELDVIEELEFVDYFLIVADYVLWSKEQGIRVGAGRGSGAGSLVGYVLSITDIDPIKYGLLFERFLNKDRVSPPDYDVDFQDDRRSEVFEYLKEKYGADNVAAIATHDTLKAKATIKDLARSLRIAGDVSMSFVEANKITKHVKDEPGITIKEALAESKELRAYAEQYRDLFRYAKDVEGLIRQSGTHAAGVIISKEPLQTEIPVKIHMRKRDRAYIATTEYDGVTLEELGYLKADLLGLRTLTIIGETLDNIKELYGAPLKSMPLNDVKTFKMLNEGLTMNVFQLESLGMRSFLQQVVVENVEDIAIVLALHRPGPLETFAYDYPDRKHGRKPNPKIHPILDEILAPTYGIMVYQEQIIQIVNRVAGFPLTQADLVRRAIGKKKIKIMQAQKEAFLVGCEKNGMSNSIADELWTSIEHFASYSFNKSHAVAYATIAYQTAFLKANYPTCFMAAVLSRENISENICEHMREVSRLRVTVAPPDINTSGVQFKVKDKGALLWDMASFKGIGKAAVELIMKARPFKSFEHVMMQDARKLNKRALIALNEVGAFSSLQTKDGSFVKRSQIEASIDNIRKQINAMKRKKIEMSEEPWFDYPDIPEWDTREILKHEVASMGYPYLHSNPYDLFKPLLPNNYDKISDIVYDIGRYPHNKMVSIVCFIESKVRDMNISAGAQKGKQAGLFVVSDEQEDMEMIIWPLEYSSIKKHLTQPRFAHLSCQVSRRREGGQFRQLILKKVHKVYL